MPCFSCSTNWVNKQGHGCPDLFNLICSIYVLEPSPFSSSRTQAFCKFAWWSMQPCQPKAALSFSSLCMRYFSFSSCPDFVSILECIKVMFTVLCTGAISFQDLRLLLAAWGALSSTAWQGRSFFEVAMPSCGMGIHAVRHPSQPPSVSFVPTLCCYEVII